MYQTMCQIFSRPVREPDKVPSFHICVHCLNPVCSPVSWIFSKSHKEDLPLGSCLDSQAQASTHTRHNALASPQPSCTHSWLIPKYLQTGSDGGVRSGACLNRRHLCGALGHPLKGLRASSRPAGTVCLGRESHSGLALTPKGNMTFSVLQGRQTHTLPRVLPFHVPQLCPLEISHTHMHTRARAHTHTYTGMGPCPEYWGTGVWFYLLSWPYFPQK